ncbi:MAG TPA: hypothetical protein VF141_02195 [Chryseolinea sp.]
MEADAERQDSLVDAAGDLIETYRDLITVKIVEHTSMGASISIVGIISLLIVVFVLLFIGFGAAWWIGDVMNNMKAGFFIVGGFYTLVLIIVLATAKSFLIPNFRNMIIKNIYEQD